MQQPAACRAGTPVRHSLLVARPAARPQEAGVAFQWNRVAARDALVGRRAPAVAFDLLDGTHVELGQLRVR